MTREHAGPRSEAGTFAGTRGTTDDGASDGPPGAGLARWERLECLAVRRPLGNPETGVRLPARQGKVSSDHASSSSAVGRSDRVISIASSVRAMVAE